MSSDSAEHIVLDAHLVVESGRKLFIVPKSFFRSLQLNAVIFVYDHPDKIARRRNLYRRDLKTRTRHAIAKLQREELFFATQLSKSKRIPIYLIKPSDGESFRRVVEML